MQIFNQIKHRKKIMDTLNFEERMIEKILFYFVAPAQAFMTFFDVLTSLMKNNILHQTDSSFLQYWLTDQICKMVPCQGPVKKLHNKFSIRLRSGQFAGHVIDPS